MKDIIDGQNFGLGSPVSFSLLFRRQMLQQIIKASLRENPIELRAIVDNETDVLDDDIIDLPFPLDAMELIVNRSRFGFIR